MDTATTRSSARSSNAAYHRRTSAVPKWTGILGGILFKASRGRHLRLSLSVVGTYLLVSLLHALWDSMRAIALILTAVLTATPAQRLAWVMGVLVPPPQQIQTFVALQIGGLVLIALVGLAILWREWHAGAREPGGRPTGAVPA